MSYQNGYFYNEFILGVLIIYGALEAGSNHWLTWTFVALGVYILLDPPVRAIYTFFHDLYWDRRDAADKQRRENP